MSGTLYAYSKNFRVQKILIAAEYSGHKVSLAQSFIAGKTDKSPEFLQKFPFGKVPAYESGSVKLFETNAIAYYVGSDQTRGGDREAEVIQWISFADNVIEPAACTWVYPTMGILQYNKQNTEKAKSDIKDALSALNSHLSTRTFLVGERVTQADISMACTLCMLYQHVLEPEFRRPYGNVNRWFVTLVNQPEFKTVLGDVTLCAKMAQFDAKKYNEMHPKDKKPKQGGGAGDSKPKQAKAPKPQEKKKPEPEEPAAPKPQKDPWVDLPPTTYDMDEFKRTYSNDKSPGKKDSIKYFWDKFDKEKYSIWHCTYNYNDEFKQSYNAANLVKGMFQRLDKMRKHSFACMSIWESKTPPKYRVDGLWFWRGQGLCFELSENWQVDYESYEWKKVDPDSEETKKLVDLFFGVLEKNGDLTLDDWNTFK